MNKTKLICTALAIVIFSTTAQAGGLLTNTNQNINFLRNPARDAAIAIDGVYSNPAGVVFLGEGMHLSIGLQNVHQTRTIKTGFPLFPNNVNMSGSVHEFEGKADAPIIPSLQAAYNKGNWSFQFGFALTGGGGKCEFPNGLGSFEQVVAGVTTYAPAVNELYQKMKERVAVQKAHQQPKVAKPASGASVSAQQRQSGKNLSKALFPICLITIVAIIILSVVFALIGESGPDTGYYTYGDRSYYYYGDWYEWENDSWQYAPYESWMDSDYESYYDSYSYDSGADYEDFEDSPYYTPYDDSSDDDDSWDDESWDSGWDSGDSWDSGYDDWGSDW